MRYLVTVEIVVEADSGKDAERQVLGLLDSINFEGLVVEPLEDEDPTAGFVYPQDGGSVNP